MTSRVPKVSVVIPTFNNEDVLRRCLTSWQLSAATCGVEIIVIEGLPGITKVNDGGTGKDWSSDSVKADDYRLKGVIENLVMSELFQKR